MAGAHLELHFGKGPLPDLLRLLVKITPSGVLTSLLTSDQRLPVIPCDSGFSKKTVKKDLMPAIEMKVRG